MKYLIWFMSLKHLDVNINLLPYILHWFGLQIVLFLIRLCTKHDKSARKQIYSITFLFLALSFWKFTFSERKFDREFKYAIGFAVGGNVCSFALFLA